MSGLMRRLAEDFFRAGGDVELVRGHLSRALDELELRDEDADAVRRALRDGSVEAVLQGFDWLLLTCPGFYDLVTCPRCRIVLNRGHTDGECAILEVMRS